MNYQREIEKCGSTKRKLKGFKSKNKAKKRRSLRQKFREMRKNKRVTKNRKKQKNEKNNFPTKTKKTKNLKGKKNKKNKIHPEIKETQLETESHQKKNNYFFLLISNFSLHIFLFSLLALPATLLTQDYTTKFAKSNYFFSQKFFQNFLKNIFRKIVFSYELHCCDFSILPFH